MKNLAKRIVLFRFHNNFAVCKNKLEIIKYYNPNIEIYGLFGGETIDLPKAKRALGKLFVNIYQVPVTDAEWKWQNGDLSLVDWYREVGEGIDFDILHLIEWDLLELGSFDEIYKHIPADGVGLTGLTPMSHIPKWRWIDKEPWKSQWAELLAHVGNKYNYKGIVHGCLGPGNVFPRAFVEAYSKLEVPTLCHEEIRFPLFAQVLGFKLYDNGFFRDWHNHTDDLFFSCAHDKKEIERSDMDLEMLKITGRRVFHPCIKIFSFELPEAKVTICPVLKIILPIDLPRLTKAARLKKLIADI
ncbi:MAG: hypothetical protein WCO23_02745 [bacterium]